MKFDKNHAMDMEVIQMVKKASAERRAMEQEANIVDAEFVEVDAKAEERVQILRQLGGVAARAMGAVVFLGAVNRGWVELGFGLFLCAACIAWAVAYARRA